MTVFLIGTSATIIATIRTAGTATTGTLLAMGGAVAHFPFHSLAALVHVFLPSRGLFGGENGLHPSHRGFPLLFLEFSRLFVEFHPGLTLLAKQFLDLFDLFIRQRQFTLHVLHDVFWIRADITPVLDEPIFEVEKSASGSNDNSKYEDQQAEAQSHDLLASSESTGKIGCGFYHNQVT